MSCSKGFSFFSTRDLDLLLLQLHITHVQVRVLSSEVQTWKNNNGYILSKL